MIATTPAVAPKVWWDGVPVLPRPIRVVEPPPEWSPEDAALVEWYRSHRDEIPAAPFQLSPGVTVVDRELFLAVIDRDVAAGPGGPRRRVLGEELAALRSLCCS